jgi:hypothetical protein
MENTPRNGLWFNPKSIQEKVAQGPWQRGLSLYLAQRVQSLEIDPHQGHWRLRGEVQGTERLPYEVSVELKLTPGSQLHSWDSDCTCPVRYQCKHGVALMVKAAYKGLQLLGAEAGAVNPVMPPTPAELDAARKAHQARMDEIARLEAEAQVLRWLESLDRASGHADETGEAAGAHGGRIRPEQYLYLLSVAGGHGPAPRLQLEAVVSYPKLNGGWAKPKPLRHPPIAGQAVYDQASAADHEVLQLMRALRAGDDHLYRYGTTFIVTPAGRIGPMTLEQAATTGRLFLDQGGGPGPAVTWGPPQPLRWAWHEVTTAQAAEPGWVLRAQLADSGAKLCLNNPPLYLDVAKGLCGLAQADGVPAAQLEALLKAPPLKPSALKKHQASLTQRLGPVPLPPMLEALPTLQGITPKACLHLYPTPAGEVAGRGLLQSQLRFDYAGRRGWWAGQGLTVLVDDAQGRVLLRRDGEAELEALSALAGLGLHATGAGAGLFGIPGKGSQTAWLRDIPVVRPLAGHRDQRPAPQHPALAARADRGGRCQPARPGTGLPTLPRVLPRRAFARSHRCRPAGRWAGNSFVRLPTDTLRALDGRAAGAGGDRSHDFSGDSLKLSRLDALRTTAALGEGAVWEGRAVSCATMVQQPARAQRTARSGPCPKVCKPACAPTSNRAWQLAAVSARPTAGRHPGRRHGPGQNPADAGPHPGRKRRRSPDPPRADHCPGQPDGQLAARSRALLPELRCLVIHGKDRHG